MLNGKTLAERWTMYAISLTAGAVLWQIAAYNTRPTFLSPFTTTVAQLWAYTIDGTLIAALASSLMLFFAGIPIVSVTLALPFALALVDAETSLRTMGSAEGLRAIVAKLEGAPAPAAAVDPLQQALALYRERRFDEAVTAYERAT